MTDRDEMDRRGQTRDFQPVDQAEFERLEDKVDALDYVVRQFTAKDQGPQPDSDGWIPWHGGPCPVNGETKVDARLHCGAELPAYRAKDLTWWHYKNRPESRIIAYRPAKQEAEWPQVGDRYWTIDAGMCVFPFNWDGGPFDKGFQNFLGIYRTREAAENAAAKIKRVMKHLRSGRSIHLWDTDNMAGREVIKL